MKTTIRLSLTLSTFLLSIASSAATFVAQAGGGDYNTATTWGLTSGSDIDGIPDSNDDITIGTGITVTVTFDDQHCNIMNIASGGILTFGGVDIFTTHGIVTVNGTINGTFSGANASFIKHVSSGGFAGTGGTISITGNLRFLTSGYIASGVTINNTGNIIIDSGFFLGLYGTVTLNGTVDGVAASSKLQCLTGSTLTVQNQLMLTAGTVEATTFGYCANNTIIFDGASAYSLGALGFENLIIRGAGIKTTSSAGVSKFSKSVTIDAGATLAQSSQSITWNGAMVNNGTFTGSGGTITYTPTAWTNNGTFSHTGIFWFTGTTAKTMSMSGSTTFKNINVKYANMTKTNGTLLLNGQLQCIGVDFSNAGGTLTIRGNYLSSSGGTFSAHTVGNIVAITYPFGAVPITTAGYYDLNIACAGAGTKTLAANTVVLRNFTINSLNTLSANNFNLTVRGNWLKNGIFTASAGKTVTFDGIVAQAITGNATTTFTGLTINNNAGVSLAGSGTFVLTEVLTVSNGTFNTAGKTFTMSSTALKTARIAPITGSGGISGNFTIQRFISTRDTTYCDLASPVQSTIFNDWDNELPAIEYLNNPPYQFASAGTYNETTDDYVAITSAATALTPGVGYEVFLSGDFSYADLPNTTINTIGVPNQGDADFSSLVSANTNGTNLVGNPFASNVSWSDIYTASGGASSGLYDFIEMYDYTIGDWAGYTSADNIEIASTQGFWVYADFSGTPSLIIPESSKTTTAVSDIKQSTKNQPYFTLKISNESDAHHYSHTFKLAANEFASNGWDKKDLPFHSSPNKTTPSLYAVVDGKNINVNNFNANSVQLEMPLTTKFGANGAYSISAAGFNFISEYTCVTLEDKLLNKTIDLLSTDSYGFAATTGDDANRFVLHLNKSGDCKTSTANTISAFESHVVVLPTLTGNTINFNLEKTTATTITVTNLLGQSITNTMAVDALNQSVEVAIPSNFSGLYLIKIESAEGVVTKKFVKK